MIQCNWDESNIRLCSLHAVREFDSNNSRNGLFIYQLVYCRPENRRDHCVFRPLSDGLFLFRCKVPSISCRYSCGLDHPRSYCWYVQTRDFRLCGNSRLIYIRIRTPSSSYRREDRYSNWTSILSDLRISTL